MRILLPSTLLFVALFAGLPVHAQSAGDAVYAFGLELTSNPESSHVGDLVHAQFVLHDGSRDTPAGLVPGAPGTALQPHTVSWRVEKIGNDTAGWIVYTPSSVITYGGTDTPVALAVVPDFTVVNPYLQVRLIAVIATGAADSGPREVSAIVLFFTTGVAGFSANPLGSLKLGPRDIGQASIELVNQATVPRGFSFEAKGNECGLGAVPPAPLVLKAKQRRVVPITLQAPPETNIFAKTCQVSFAVASSDNPANPRLVTVMAQISGVYVDPLNTFWVIVAILAIILLLLFIKRRKEKLDEEILGKPQKPWLIPVEKVYLKHLKAKDERAWYVVRHYLMEDEYRSALLWYRAYKKGTKGGRKRERLILKQEKSYTRWKASWQKAIAKPLQEADRLDAKLQRKLDRKAAKLHRKETRKWKTLCAKLTEVAAKSTARAEEKHAKEARKAEKKGLPVPKAPRPEAAQLPPAPALVALPLASHRLGKKSERFRRRMAKRQGNLEVKFERADARHLAKLERKVRKLARKLDDPTFVDEHPLLRGAASR